MERKAGGGTTSSMEAFLEERAQQLFLLSDQERKGFIVKRDMQRMRAEIPLTPEQLEAVFDSLDVNNNGYLTIEQFLSGFGNIDILRQLCHRVVREGTSNIQNNLESFLLQLANDLRRYQEEQRSLEEALRLKDEEHESHVRRLFEEMESQLHEEKKVKARQEEQRQRLKHNSLEQDLEGKEQQLQDALRRQQELADRKDLQTELETERREIVQLQHFLADVQQNEAWEKRKHLSAGFRLAQKIMLEQQGLMQQLRLLQDMTSTLEREDGDQRDTNKSRVQNFSQVRNMRMQEVISTSQLQCHDILSGLYQIVDKFMLTTQ
ncbi:EF-hand calcium-binding domain-containing protein 4A [Blattella germanica]|nr:EF-hand calcium-binding domain-containing protein 4A [Blattella germanica]